MKKVILVGDSIRLGYQETVRGELCDEAEVRGPEENGGHTRNVLEHLDEWVLSQGPDVVHVNSGLHDIRRETKDADPVVPLGEYRDNVQRILRCILDEARAEAVWATTTPVNQRWHHENKDFERLEDDVLAYNRAAMEICQDLAVPVDNLFEAVMEEGRNRLLLDDGVHFTEEGYRLLGRTVADAVRKCCLLR
jgi:lysophospholipase L1-like esterase